MKSPKFDAHAVYSLQEVADLFRVSERTIFRLIHGQSTKGVRLPATKIGHSWRIAGVDVMKFLSDNANMRNAIFMRGAFSTPKRTKGSRKKG